MNTNQVLDVLKKDIVAKQYKSFCLPSDFLDRLTFTSFPTIIVVNTSPSRLLFGHWIGLLVMSRKTIEVFDTYGRNYSEWKNIGQFVDRFEIVTQNRRKIQNTMTMACGFHVLVFILLRLRRYSFQSIVNIFTPNSLWNDFLSENIIVKFFNVDFKALSPFCIDKHCEQVSLSY